MKNRTQLVLIIAFVFIATSSFAQFEQKLTINGAGTFIYPDIQDIPKTRNGYGIDGGIQFNFSKSFSIYGAARFYYMFGGASYEYEYYDNIAFGGGIKMNMIPHKPVNPYVFAEANLNFIWLEEYFSQTRSYSSDFGMSIGGLGGFGLNFRLNDNIAFYMQSGVYYTLWDARINLYNQIGVRINMIKSKTI